MAEGKLPNVRAMLDAFGKEAVKRLQDALTKADSIAVGNLFQSIDYEVRFFGQTYKFRLFFNPPGDEYAQAVDTGRRPGKMPPIDPILKWVIAKPIRLTPKRSLKKGKKRNKQSEARSLAFLIARKIGRKGTKGSRFWSDNIPTLVDELKKDLSIAFKKDILIQIKEIKKEFK